MCEKLGARSNAERRRGEVRKSANRSPTLAGAVNQKAPAQSLSDHSGLGSLAKDGASKRGDLELKTHYKRASGRRLGGNARDFEDQREKFRRNRGWGDIDKAWIADEKISR